MAWSKLVEINMVALVLVFIFIGVCRALPLNSDDVIQDSSIDPADRIDISHLGPEAYGPPRNQSGVALSQWTKSSLMNPEELGEYAEGDILMPHLNRNGIKDASSRWPNGIIPYVIQGQYNQEQHAIIMKAIADYHRLTCLRFVHHRGEKDYIAIVSDHSGCWSSIGRMGGRQEVNLQVPGCVSKKGTVIHELLHVVGFMHEQSRPERDEYVTLFFNNMKTGSENNFKKANPKTTKNYGVPYDYNSVMHYSEYAFSKNGQKTIQSKVSGTKLGQRGGFSRGDVRKLNNMYNCNKEEPQAGWGSGAVWQGFFGKMDESKQT